MDLHPIEEGLNKRLINNVLIYPNHYWYLLTIRSFFLFLGENVISGGNEHIAFLRLRALELQGEVQEAFMHAVIYKALDPEVYFFVFSNKKKW